MKIKHLHLLKMLALAASMTALTQAATVEVEWPDAWTDAPDTAGTSTSTTTWLSGTTGYKDGYFTTEDGKSSFAAQYNVGIGYGVYALYFNSNGTDAGVNGDIWLNLTAGSVGNVASTNTQGATTGKSYTLITNVGGDANYYYAGDVSTSMIMGGSLILATGNSTSTTTSGTEVNYLYQSTVGGTARIYVDDNASTATIIGGSYVRHSLSLTASEDGSYTGTSIADGNVGATEITIASGTVAGDIYGGGYISTVSKNIANDEGVDFQTTANILGNTNIIINGGKVGFDGAVILGGGFVTSSGTDGEARVLGDTNITITGGDITANIYGGGLNSGNVGNADVEGNTYINISGGTITGNVTASGLNYSDTYGDATITLSGSATISGNISAETPTSTVRGTTTLNLGTEDEGYSETVQNVDGFDVVNVAEKSDTTVAGSFSNVGTLNVSGSLTLSESTDAASINIAKDASLSVTATGSTIFSNTSLEWENLGTLNISASDDAVAGFTYTIFASDVNADDYGKITSSDGTISGNTYTVGTEGVDYTQVVLDTKTGTTVYSDSISIVSIAASDTDPTSIVVMDVTTASSVTITAVSTVSDSTSFENYLSEEESSNLIEISAAYQFDLSEQLNDGDYVLISLYVGSDDYDVTQFTVYHKDRGEDSTWEVYYPTDLTYEDGYLSFTVYSFSSYGYSAKASTVDTEDGDGTIPEPSTATLSLMALTALIARRRRKN